MEIRLARIDAAPIVMGRRLSTSSQAQRNFARQAGACSGSCGNRATVNRLSKASLCRQGLLLT